MRLTRIVEGCVGGVLCLNLGRQTCLFGTCFFVWGKAGFNLVGSGGTVNVPYFWC